MEHLAKLLKEKEGREGGLVVLVSSRMPVASRIPQNSRSSTVKASLMILWRTRYIKLALEGAYRDRLLVLAPVEPGTINRVLR